MSGIRTGFLLPLFCGALTLAACDKGPEPGKVFDEAKLVGRTADSFPQADEDWFHDMDNGIALTPEEVRGRNMWNVWSGGNDRLWDLMSDYTYGAFDLLKIISNHPDQGYSRANRWTYLGLVNEPCFEQPKAPRKDRYGLWLDVRGKGCEADPFENESKYPGVAIGARGKSLGEGKTHPVGSYYGYASGVLGLRLFPNPADGWLHIQWAGAGAAEKTTVELFSIAGKVVRREAFVNNLELSVEGLPAGVYVVVLRNRQGVVVRRVVVG